MIVFYFCFFSAYNARDWCVYAAVSVLIVSCVYATCTFTWLEPIVHYVYVAGSRNLNLNVPSVDKERLLAHLDHSNPNTFEIEDLSKLIKQVCCLCLLFCWSVLMHFILSVTFSYNVWTGLDFLYTLVCTVCVCVCM